MVKRRVIIYVVTLITLLTCVSVGTVAAVQNNKFKNNNISFIVGSENAYCSLEAKYYYCGEEKVEQAYEKKTYTETERYSKEGFSGFGSWTNLNTKSYFDKNYDKSEPETIMFEFHVTNLSYQDDLYISLYDIAVGEQLPSQGNEVYFYTTISYEINGAETIMFTNSEPKVNYDMYINQGQSQKITLNTESTVCKLGKIESGNMPVNAKIKIKMERKTIVSRFNIKNNIKVNFSTSIDN